MKHTRRHAFKMVGLSLALTSLGPHAAATERDDDDDGFRADHVFTSTNAVAGNELLVYAASHEGALALRARLSTRGAGTGTGLGNQGAVTLSASGRFLFVVNALSNSVSTFAVRRHGLELRSTVDSGGQRPISVTEHDGIVYVLNAEGAGNVTGFHNFFGHLRLLSGSTQPLSASGGAGPAQVGFSPDGEVLLVTEKDTNKLTSYRVRPDGRISAPMVTASAAPPRSALRSTGVATRWCPRPSVAPPTPAQCRRMASKTGHQQSRCRSARASAPHRPPPAGWWSRPMAAMPT